ncbi:MAG: mycothiol conjugate amidase Mca [Micrococcales bacterium]|nr:MAG: mycothiol conjugate amidase Mca [Micrococcales bacterium]PIE26037.1 MAG: mycothiol conjugate amidase Mca [Micrococcales bacterium]
MCVHAHPDDESSKGAPVMAMYRAQGVRVLVVTCTGGERGDILNPKLADDPSVLRDMVEYRRQEMAAAVQILGVEHAWLGFVDSGLPQGDPIPPLPPGCFALEPVEVAAEPLVRLVREFRPHVMTAYDENGGYPHPDHIMCHTVSMAAFNSAGDPDAYPAEGPPWQPLKIYYNQTFSAARMRAFHQVLLDAGRESPYAERIELMGRQPDRPVHARIECADFFAVRDRALKAHATQVDPDGLFFALDHDLQRKAWPWEDYELGASALNAPAEIEDDLFAGIRGRPELIAGGGAALGPGRAGADGGR